MSANLNSPRIARWLLRLLLRGEEREALLGDLTEEYGAVLRERGPRAARRWFWRQTLDALRSRAASSPTDTERAAAPFYRPGGKFMETVWQDLRFSLRGLRKSPGFTAVAVVTLALGIGANTAIFSVVEAALLRSLPYREPERLVHIWETRTNKQFAQMEASYPNYVDWQRENTVFEAIAGYNGTNFTHTGSGTPERVSGTRVTANFFEVLGVQPQLGRTFRPEEEAASANPVALVSHGFWQRQLGGATDVVGRTVRLSGTPYTVIGVMPPHFQFSLDAADIWVPLAMNDDQRERRTYHWLRPVARLRSSATLEEAQAQMAAIAARLEQAYHATNAGTGARVLPLREEIAGPIRPMLLILFAAVSLLLLLACVNVANLLLARATSRSREIAIRAALGAGRARLVRQLLVESLLLAAIGGAAALAAAQWSAAVLVQLLPAAYLMRFPQLAGLSLSAPVLAFAALVTLVTGVLFGLVPALQATRLSLTGALKEGGAGGAGRAPLRLRSALVVAQISIALVLLAGTGLVLRSLTRLLEVNPGFRTENLATMRVSVPASRYATDEQVASFYERLLRRVAAQPGVRAAALIDEMPVTHDGGTSHIFVEGRPEPPPSQEHEAVTRTASRGYFEMMGIPLMAGRLCDQRDARPAGHGASGTFSLLLTETLARQLFPGEDPVGRRAYFKFRERIPALIIGVVADVNMAGLDRPIRPALYFCFEQDTSRSSYVVVRSELDTATVAAAVRREAAALDPEVPVYALRAMGEVIARSEGVFVRRSVSFLLGAFAAVAVLLAGVGLYGVMNFAVTARVREIGVRLALGAQPGDVLRMVLRDGLRLAATGLLIGVLAALAATRLMSGLLFGVAPSDPATFAAVALLLATVAMAACLIPAYRATRVDPLVALRHE